MALVGSVIKQVDIPHEPGQWMRFKQLSWSELEVAQRALMTQAQQVAAGTIQAMGRDAFKAVQEAAADMAKPDAPVEPPKPGDGYHGPTLLRLSLVAWSYEPDLTPEAIGQLDKRTFDWAVAEAAALSDPREPEEDRKNGLLAFSSHSTG